MMLPREGGNSLCFLHRTLRHPHRAVLPLPLPQFSSWLTRSLVELQHRLLAKSGQGYFWRLGDDRFLNKNWGSSVPGILREPRRFPAKALLPQQHPIWPGSEAGSCPDHLLQFAFRLYPSFHSHRPSRAVSDPNFYCLLCPSPGKLCKATDPWLSPPLWIFKRINNNPRRSWKQIEGPAKPAGMTEHLIATGLVPLSFLPRLLS